MEFKQIVLKFTIQETWTESYTIWKHVGVCLSVWMVVCVCVCEDMIKKYFYWKKIYEICRLQKWNVANLQKNLGSIIINQNIYTFTVISNMNIYIWDKYLVSSFTALWFFFSAHPLPHRRRKNSKQYQKSKNRNVWWMVTLHTPQNIPTSTIF